MTANDDYKLDQWLDSYQVKDADASLLEAILADSTHPRRLPSRAPFAWMQNAALIAATAVLGFWLGNSSLETSSMQSLATPSGNTLNIDQIIMGPKSLGEVML